MKKVAYIFAPLVGVILRLFFDKKYLQGRWFSESLGGYRWALSAVWTRSILRLGPVYPWPVHYSCHISNSENIEFDPDDINNFQARGSYFQCANGRIFLGKGCYIAPNVGLITQNHDPVDPSRNLPSSDIFIGPKCWIGMNSVILPGVTLGPNVVVAAGAVVTNSYEEGYVVLAGVPAHVVKRLERSC